MDEIRRAFTASLHAAQAAGDLIEITLKNGAVHQLHPPSWSEKAILRFHREMFQPIASTSNGTKLPPSER